MTQEIGICSWAVAPGGIELNTVDLAQVCRTTEKAVHRSLGGRTMRVTKGEPVLLARDAAQACLARVGCGASEIDAIVWLGEQLTGLRLQDELGAAAAYLMCIAGDCSEALTALSVARGLVIAGAHRVLVASGERYGYRHTDTVPTEQNYRNFLGDCGSGLLVGPTGSRRIAGLGFASRGAEWKYLAKVDALMKGEPVAGEMPFYAQVFRESIPVAQAALQRCLDDAGIQMHEVDHFCFSSIRLRPLLLPLLRILRVPETKLRAHPTFVHMGQSDVALDIQALAENPEVRPGDQAVIMASGTGVFRCVALRI